MELYLCGKHYDSIAGNHEEIDEQPATDLTIQAQTALSPFFLCENTEFLSSRDLFICNLNIHDLLSIIFSPSLNRVTLSCLPTVVRRHARMVKFMSGLFYMERLLSNCFNNV